MSIQLMNQVFDLQLPPVQKLVLVILADAANDKRICWPSLNYVAHRSSVSARTVQRVICELEQQKLLARRPRYRADGSQSSNEYTLFPNDQGGDNLSPPFIYQTPNDTDGMPTMPVEGDSVVIQTTNETSFKTNNHHNLIFPSELDGASRRSAIDQLKKIDESLHQILLDELAGRMQKGKIHTSPLSYLRALVNKAIAGDFTPELAPAIRKIRESKMTPPIPINTAPPPSQESKEIALQHISQLKKRFRGQR